MKKSIASIKQNPEFLIPVLVLTTIVVLVTYNIFVYGITSTSSFEF